MLLSTFLSLLNMGSTTPKETTSVGSNATSPRTVKSVLCYLNLGFRIIAVGILAAFLSQKHNQQFMNDREKGLLIGALVSYSWALWMEVLHVGVSEAYPEVPWQGKPKAMED
jgi:hypothetical protein